MLPPRYTGRLFRELVTWRLDAKRATVFLFGDTTPAVAGRVHGLATTTSTTCGTCRRRTQH